MEQITIWEVLEQDAVTVASLLSEATTVLTSAVSSVWSIMTGNVWMQFLIGASILSIGFRFFRKAKKAAGH